MLAKDEITLSKQRGKDFKSETLSYEVVIVMTVLCTLRGVSPLCAAVKTIVETESLTRTETEKVCVATVLLPVKVISNGKTKNLSTTAVMIVTICKRMVTTHITNS